jgi:hypothetical protein
MATPLTLCLPLPCDSFSWVLRLFLVVIGAMIWRDWVCVRGRVSHSVPDAPLSC